MKLKVYYQENKILKSKFIYNDSDLYPNNIVIIKPIKNLSYYLNMTYSSYDDVVNLFKELNLILQTNISLGEAIDILLQSGQTIKIKEILESMKISIANAQPLNDVLERYKRYLTMLPALFFKLSNINGNVKDSIYALSLILIENQRAKKKILNALAYPIVLAITLFLSFIFVFNFVLPNFEYIFLQFGSNLPMATKSLLCVKEFFDKFYLLFIVLGVFVWLLVPYIYIRKKSFFDKIIAMHIPVVSSLYKRFVLHRFFLSLQMIVKSHQHFQIALENAKVVVDNVFLLSKIEQIIYDIKNGNTIASAFENSSIFDTLTIRLLNTAQQTNTIPKTLENITITYRQKLDDDIDNFSKAISPVFILIISSFILWLIFALMLPIWDLGSVLN